MDDAAALKRCIALGMGISILSRATVQTDAQQGPATAVPPRTVSVPAPAVHCVSVHTTYVPSRLITLSGFYKKILSDQMTAVRTDRYTAVLSSKVKTGKSGFLKFTGYGLDNRDNLREHYTDRNLLCSYFLIKSRKLWRNIIMSKDEYLITDAPLKASDGFCNADDSRQLFSAGIQYG